MKSEAEIRKHLEDLKVCASMPCDCHATGHTTECFIGSKMMAATIGELSWILGEAPEYDAIAARLSASAERYKRTGEVSCN